MTVYKVVATGEHGRTWVVSIRRAADARAAVREYLAEGHPVPGRTYRAVPA